MFAGRRYRARPYLLALSAGAVPHPNVVAVVLPAPGSASASTRANLVLYMRLRKTAPPPPVQCVHRSIRWRVWAGGRKKQGEGGSREGREKMVAREQSTSTAMQPTEQHGHPPTFMAWASAAAGADGQTVGQVVDDVMYHGPHQALRGLPGRVSRACQSCVRWK